VVGSYEGARSLSVCLATHDGHGTPRERVSDWCAGLPTFRRHAGVRSRTGPLSVRRRDPHYARVAHETIAPSSYARTARTRCSVPRILGSARWRWARDLDDEAVRCAATPTGWAATGPPPRMPWLSPRLPTKAGQAGLEPGTAWRGGSGLGQEVLLGADRGPAEGRVSRSAGDAGERNHLPVAVCAVPRRLKHELTRCLRTGRAARRPSRKVGQRKDRIPNMINVSERPAEARIGPCPATGRTT
jgi:hypothetical protein